MILSDKQHWGTIIVGGSQSGLATGYYLKKIRKDFIILETSDHIGQTRKITKSGNQNLVRLVAK